MVVAMRGEGLSLRSGAPELLFPDSDASGPWYSVAPDGRHFAIVAENPDALARKIHVVLNWFSELKVGGPTSNRRACSLLNAAFPPFVLLSVALSCHQYPHNSRTVSKLNPAEQLNSDCRSH